MKTYAWAVLLALAGAALAAQLVPAERIDLPLPPSSLPMGDIAAPPQIEALLTRACYDCHSNQTRWPWYGRIAPASWLIARDVSLGRKELNFSEWAAYYPRTRKRKLQWIGRALREHRMPPWGYRLIHPRARLTGTDRAMLEQWIEFEISSQPHRATTD